MVDESRPSLGPRPTALWQCNNNVRQSAFAEDQDRLTLPENWGQIAAGRRFFAFFAGLALLLEAAFGN
jgi:hypothetical protein